MKVKNENASAIVEGALMIVLIAFTVFFQAIINDSYGPLTHFLPLSLADMTYGKNDANVAAAAQELDDQASARSVRAEAEGEAAGESTAAEKRSVRKRPSVPGSSSRSSTTMSSTLSWQATPFLLSAGFPSARLCLHLAA